MNPIEDQNEILTPSPSIKEEAFTGVPSFKNKTYNEDVKKKIRETKKHFKTSPSLRKNILKINALKKYGPDALKKYEEPISNFENIEIKIDNNPSEPDKKPVVRKGRFLVKEL